MNRFALALALTACAPDQAAQNEPAALPADQAPAPVALTWDFQGYFIKGSNTTITVEGGPTAGPAAFLISTAAAGAPACPPPFAPECLSIPAPASVFLTRTFVNGSTTFNINVPAAAPPTQVWVQAVGLAGPARFATPGVRAELLVASADFDSDGITNIEEALTFRTSPLRADTDNDGLADGDEVGVGSDPLDTDSDDDGLRDGEEVTTWGTNPISADTDGDGLDDFFEALELGTDPTSGDTDGDGLGDSSEHTFHGTDPVDADSDDDGLNDGVEVLFVQSNPLDADSDDDALLDGAEVNVHLTNPNQPDTDNGGLADGDEIAAGKNPLNPADDVPPPTFVADIYPRISLVRCAGCHTGGGASGGFNQDVYANWLAPSRQAPALRRITPGNPATSYLWHKVNNTQNTVGGFGSRMPLGGLPLPPDELALIDAWIRAGAPQQ